MKTEPLLKFPRTPHLRWLASGSPRDDKLLSESEMWEFLSNPLIVEEKIDGANLGISVDSDGRIAVQNRGTWLGERAHPQFSPLWPWLNSRKSTLIEALGQNLILFGEWCFAVHSVRYSALPDWFVAFDVLDRSTGVFWTCERRNDLCARIGIKTVPELCRGTKSFEELRGLLEGPSLFGAPNREGLYLRVEREDRLVARAKLVRPEFAEGITEHWAKRKLERNRLASEG